MPLALTMIFSSMFRVTHGWAAWGVRIGQFEVFLIVLCSTSFSFPNFTDELRSYVGWWRAM